jgi:hypothetical protein
MNGLREPKSSRLAQDSSSIIADTDVGRYIWVLGTHVAPDVTELEPAVFPTGSPIPRFPWIPSPWIAIDGHWLGIRGIRGIHLKNKNPIKSNADCWS